MQVEKSERDGVGILRLKGEFDSFETELVRAGFEQAIASDGRSVVMDLSEMSFANSTTLAYFITARNRAAAEGGRLVLVKPNEFVRKTLRTLGLEDVLEIADSLDEALAALKSS